MKIISGFLSWLVIIIVCLFPVEMVQADIAPPGPTSGSNILPGQTTEVRMMAETVILTVQPSGSVAVDANFIMRNLSETEERMDVYFPLNFPSGWSYPGDITQLCVSFTDGPKPIDDLSAWVNGVQKGVQTKYTEDLGPGKTGVTIPCWATFQVIFPPDQDIKIRVTYTTVTWDYILQTGSGWKGTIGSADIIIRLPYKINRLNFIDCGYYGSSTDKGTVGQVSDNEMRWHHEDFEPSGDFAFNIRSPKEWIAILAAEVQTQKNSQDAEAWGQLGKAYKELIKYIEPRRELLDRQGNPHVVPLLANYRDDVKEIIQLSADAYQRAVELKPNDADWHYGYAELLCLAALQAEQYSDEFSQYASTCMLQLKLTLENQPTSHHQDARLLLEFFPDNVVNLDGSTPNYTILTPQAPTLALTATPTATQPLQPGIETLTPTATKTIRVSSTQTPALPVVMIPTAGTPAQEPSDNNTSPICGSILIPLISIIVLSGTIRKTNHF